MATASLKQRVAVGERDSKPLRARKRGSESAARPWWDQIVGTFDDDPIFDEAMRLGREYRESLRPKQPKRKGRRNAHPRH